MSYLHADKTKLLATRCICCGKPLCDAESVERGIGPDCSDEGYGQSVDPSIREAANIITRDAAIAAQRGDIAMVEVFAAQIKQLGLERLSSLMLRRFKNADRLAKIVISEEVDRFLVETPFRRKDKVAFIAAWRAIPGRQLLRRNGHVYNVIPKTQKVVLWNLLKHFFAGNYVKGPKGLFKIVGD